MIAALRSYAALLNSHRDGVLNLGARALLSAAAHRQHRQHAVTASRSLQTAMYSSSSVLCQKHQSDHSSNAPHLIDSLTLKSSGTEIVKQAPDYVKLLSATVADASPAASADPESSESLHVGDLVEVRRQGKVHIGVIIKITNNGFSSHMTLLGNGHTLLHSQTDVFFRIRGWAFTHASPIPGASTEGALGISTITAAQLQINNMSRGMTHNITDFQRTVDTQLTASRPKLLNLHDYIAKSNFETDISGSIQFNVNTAAEMVFSTEHPTPTQLYTTYLFLCKSNAQFTPKNAHQLLKTGLFSLRSTKESQRIQWILEQVRKTISGDTKTHFSLYLSKCKTLIEWSRRGTTEAVARPNISYTEQDKIFIDVIKQSLSVAHNFPSFEHSFAWIHVIKRIAPLYSFYPDEADVILFLKETGIHAPWENISLHQSNSKGRPSFIFGEEGELITSKSDLLSRKLCAQHSISMDDVPMETHALDPEYTSWDVSKRLKADFIAVPSSMTDPAATVSGSSLTDDFYKTDVVAPSRVDFGDEPVYIIDSSIANELDDGISYQETADGVWIHVHIADPTAHIPPHHELSMLAQLRGNSLYLPERHYPMIPDYLSGKILGLSASSNTLTFSARLSSEGDIIDYKVQPGLIRKPVITRYGDVDDVLDWSRVYGMDAPRSSLSSWTRTYLNNHEAKMASASSPPPDKNSTSALNKIAATAPAASTLTSDDAAKLQRLHEFALLHQRWRIQNGAFTPDQISSSVRVEPHPLPSVYDPTSPHATPDIVLSEPDLPHLSPSHILVSEMMIIAGRVASKFCQDHHLPVPYRGQASIFDSPKAYSGNKLADHETRKFIELQLLSRDEESGVIPLSAMLGLIRYLPAGQWSTEPIRHSSMGIGGACPLKRGKGDSSTGNWLGSKDGSSPSLSSMTGYVKASSPLRRYNDMVVHWQIKSVFIRQQQQQNPSLAGLVGGSARAAILPPFTLDQIQKLIPFLQRSTMTVNDVSTRADRFWKLEWIRRRELLSLAGHSYDPTLLRMCAPLAAVGSSGGSSVSAASQFVTAAITPLDYSSGRGVPSDQHTHRKQVNVYTAVVLELPEMRRGAYLRVAVIELGGLRTSCEAIDGVRLSMGDVIECVVDKCDPSMGRLQLKQI
ncbi:hypothetical protein BASA61_001657 [Batrachochytrium salamandrivorans]|nr:hypothetical protein BASA61_001657 [Batrachochytrium salamandrivorans]KAH9264497.1 hypothetical protein BASA83_012030 [Batrachochytrium salamandrivorans]